VYETPTAVSVTVELAGVEHEEVRVSVLGNALVVEGRRRLPNLHEDGIYHVVEIRRGAFRAEITLPARVETQPSALRSELGFLFVTFNKAGQDDGR
jgi:HSP20 family molecular chaperone IbpA